MRKEEFYVDSFVHVYNRGNKKMPIVYDGKDSWRFLQSLFYFNDEHAPDNLFRTLHDLWKSDFYNKLEWPECWPERDPLVKIIAFILVKNHFHLILKEIKEGGVTKFMRKLGTGFTNYFNVRHKESGRIFQGSYKAKHIDQDGYLEYLAVYIMVKNAFELYPGGLKRAVANFDDAYKFASNYPYGSLSAYAGEKSPALKIINIDDSWLKTDFATPKKFKEFAHRCMMSMDLDSKLGKFTID